MYSSIYIEKIGESTKFLFYMDVNLPEMLLCLLICHPRAVVPPLLYKTTGCWRALNYGLLLVCFLKLDLEQLLAME